MLISFLNPKKLRKKPTVTNPIKYILYFAGLLFENLFANE